MKEQIFQEILNSRITKIQEILGTKAKEYALNNDRLYNFREAARIGDESMEKALDGMMRKHLVSVMGLIKYPELIKEPLIDEKIGDMINYLILLEAVLREKLIKRTKPEIKD